MVPGLFGRQRHDKKHMAALQSSQAEGKSYRFVTRSKKTVHPDTGEKLKRGTIVRSTASTSPKPSGNTFQLKINASPGHVETKKTFVPGDYNKPGTPIVDRPTTAALGASLKEAPAKTQARMKAQSEGKTSYTAPGSNKPEYAGRTTNTFTITPPKVKSSFTMTPSTPEAPKKAALSISPPSSGSGGGPFGRNTTNVVPWISGMSKGGQKSMSRYGGKKSYSYRHRVKKNISQ